MCRRNSALSKWTYGYFNPTDPFVSTSGNAIPVNIILDPFNTFVSSAAYNQAKPDIVLMAVTSQMRTRVGFGEAVIQDWQAAGLLKPSAIKPIVFTAEKTIVRKTLGQLSDKDQKYLRVIIESFIG